MKKLFIIAVAAIALASCGSDKYEDWAMPQSSEEEASKAVSFSVTGNTENIDFAIVTTDSVQLFTPVLVSEDAVASQTITVTLYNNDKSKEYKLTASDKGKVATSDLKAAIESLFGKAGDKRTINGVVNNAIVLTRGEGFTRTAEITVSAQLVKPNFEEYIYEVGNNNSWGEAGVSPLRSVDLDGEYLGYAYLNGEFKFRSHKDSWEAPDWGKGANEGDLVEKDEANIPAPATTGFYRIEASLANGTYKLTAINVGVIGSATPNGWDADADMAYDVTEKAWIWTGDLKEGEIKFRVNDGWDISWGGANDDPYNVNNLTEKNGKNLKIDNAGNYTIKLYIACEGSNKVTITKN